MPGTPLRRMTSGRNANARRALVQTVSLLLLCAAGTLPAQPARPLDATRGKGAAQTPDPEAGLKEAAAEKSGSESPWLLLPVISSSPKLGTSLGALSAYLHHFDEHSNVSMLGLLAQYTTTGSIVGGAFANTSFAEDHHRVIAFVAGGRIKNDYDNFLGTGVPLKSEDVLNAAAGRYLYRVGDDWFAGLQAIYTNYTILGQRELDDQILTVLGLTGFRSGGVGAVAYHDSRDNPYMPTTGWVLNVNNIAYRDWIAGSNNFDVYRMDFRAYWEHGMGNVFAVRQNNQWTANAPPAAYAPVILRGYTFGQYLGKNMSSVEGEERLRIAHRWTATVFAGIACLYGASLSCTDSKNVYPAYGAGIQFLLKPKEGIVASLEYAKGKGYDQGVYLKLGYGF